MQTDYLIIGAGAQGLIFADELLTHSDADIVLVDRRDRVGGHWNDAYGFVRLHQPSAYYGVGSKALGRDQIETKGLNEGLFEQATGLEVLSYFEDVFRNRMLASGRVRFLPLHDYAGDWQEDHRLTSLANGQVTNVQVNRAIVDTGWYGVQTPESHVPSFSIEKGTPFTTPKRLPTDLPGHGHVAILGGGKTSMDVVIWLIERGVSPDAINWVRPRDSWLTNREVAQPGDAGYLRLVQSQANRIAASVEATSVEDLYVQMERRDELFRIDPAAFPTMFHGATISRGELDVLWKVKTVIGGQRVTALRSGHMETTKGEHAVPMDTLFVDCTARAFNFQRPAPVFDGKRITPKVIRDGLVSLSAAAIAYIEATYDDQDQKNLLTAQIPYEEDLVTLPKRYLTDMTNQGHWSTEKGLRRWARAHRLTGYGGPADGEAEAKLKVLGERMRQQRPAAIKNLERLISMGSART
ncbi:MAG: NAD(P)-binding protein [Pseudomonadota bacterium]